MSYIGRNHSSEYISPNLFKDVKYYLIGNIDEKVEHLLNTGGGKRDHYLSEMITYVIADDPTDSEYSDAKDLFELPVVTSRWVILSVRCGSLLPNHAFQPETEQIFSGVTACPSQVSPTDNKLLWAAITSNGGQYQLDFNTQVTHLLTTSTTGSKYNVATRHPDKINIVTPDWAYDCVLNKSHLDTVVYHPRLITDGITKSQDVPLETEFPSTPPDSSLLSDDPRDSPKGAKTKEALARMVSSRIMASWKAPELEPLPPAPPTAVLPSPIIPSATPPVRAMGAPRGMLRNITNSGLPLRGRGSRGPRSPRSPRGRGARGAPRINQLVHGFGMGGIPGMMMSPSMMSTGGFLAGQQPFPFGSLPPVSSGPAYFGHDPAEVIPQDLCLMGCVFYITDYQKYLENDKIQTWKMVIEQHGGEVDDTYTNRVTHVLCEHQQSDVFQLAKRDNKRLVTAYWLNDVLVKKKMLPPWLAIHIPNIYGSEKPLQNFIICVTNFEGDDRTRLKHMTMLMGAKYTGYMTHSNSVLICKKPEGNKYQKAIEWKLPIVNVQWLTDIVIGDLSPLKLPVHTQYQNFTGNPFALDLSKVASLLDGWKMPVKIKEAWKKFSPSQILKSQESQSSSQGLKRPADDQKEPVAKKPRQDENNPPQQNGTKNGPIVLITGIPKSKAYELQTGIEKLGGQVISVAKGCTHLLTNSVSRTVKFLSAITIAKYIVTPNWLEESVVEGNFVDEAPFILQDDKAESQYKFKLADSLKRASMKPLFKELTFFMTPSVVPGKATLKEIVTNAGGKLVDRQPSVRTIRNNKNEKGQPTFVVIACDEDLSLCHELTKRNIGVYNAEFILTGIIKQELDFESYRIN